MSSSECTVGTLLTSISAHIHLHLHLHLPSVLKLLTRSTYSRQVIPDAESRSGHDSSWSCRCAGTGEIRERRSEWGAWVPKKELCLGKSEECHGSLFVLATLGGPLNEIDSLIDRSTVKM